MTRPTDTPASTVQPLPGVLDRNLALLRARSAPAVERILAASPSTAAEFFRADDGAVAGAVRDPAGVSRQLASRRGPLAEADRLASSVDIASAATVVVRGFGPG